jgi:hypothetical protein|uniref:Uncharacterized protein n=1 Tax=viral metagenome TaxID=1070528 RepID=A0A6C0IR61_9ZZZZ
MLPKSSTILLHRVINIELFALKNVCPLVYKCNTKQQYIEFGNYTLTHNNHFMVDDVLKTQINLPDVYFKNGYNEYISLENHTRIKYNIYN